MTETNDERLMPRPFWKDVEDELGFDYQRQVLLPFFQDVFLEDREVLWRTNLMHLLAATTAIYNHASVADAAELHGCERARVSQVRDIIVDGGELDKQHPDTQYWRNYHQFYTLVRAMAPCNPDDYLRDLYEGERGSMMPEH